MSSTFWKVSADKLLVFKKSQAQVYFLKIHMKYVVFMSLWPRTIKILISNWPRTRKFSQFFKNTGGEDLFLPWSRVGHALRPIFMLWLVKVWQVSSCGKFMQHLKTCLLLTVFFHWMYKMKCSCYKESSVISWLVCLLVFWLRDASLVKVENPISDGIVFVFHLAWCVRGFKSLKRFWPYFIAFRSCISNGKSQ